MNKDKVQNQNILGTLVNKDESGIIAYSDQIYDKKANKSLEEENTKQNERLDNAEAKDRELQSTLENITKTGEASAASNVTYNHNDSQLDATNVQQAIDEISTKTVFDISAYHATDGTLATYDNLEDALGTNGNNIPSALRKSGMSVKFVQSSDNKYVQYRLMANEFTTDTTQWAIADEGVYVENPEFIYIKTDKDDKILWAIRTDGSIYYGACIPPQIKDYIEERIADLSLDEYEDIVAFLNGLEEGDKTLQMLLNEKVDKEEGKSLIDAEYAEGVHYIESPEFAEIKVDAEQRILEATYKDGTKLFPAGFRVNGVAEYGGATVTTITNHEFTAVWLDNSNRILLGIKNNADIFLGYGVPSQIKDYIDEEIYKVSPEGVHELIDFIGEYLGSTTLQELLDKKVDGEYVENPEYIDVKLGSEDKILEGIRKDGTKVIGGNLQVLGSLDIKGTIYSVVSNPEWFKVVVDADNRVICGIKVDGKFYVGDADFLDDIKTIKARLENLDIFSTIDHPEFIDVKTDADDRIVEAIRNDGTKVLPAGVETPKVNLEAANIENKANPEYVEVKVDEENKLLEGTKSDGTKVIGGNLEVGNNLNVKGDVEVEGNVSYKNGIPQAIIDYVAANTGSGITNIEYEDETGDMYATFDDADGVTDVYMDENGDIYAEIEE